MRSMLHVVGGVAVAGVVAAGATAFTGSGLTNSAGATAFVGGTVSQSITGATLSSVSYAYSDSAKTQLTGITMGLTGAATHSFTLATTGGSFTTATRWTCSDGTTNGNSTVATLSGSSSTSSTNTVTCTTTDSSGTATGYFSGLTSISVTVA